MTPAPELLDFAEAPNSTLLPAPGIDVHDNRRFLLVLGPAFASVVALAVDAQGLPGVVAEVRALVPPEIPPMWWLDRPRDRSTRRRGCSPSACASPQCRGSRR